MNSISLINQLKQIVKLLIRYNLVIFIVIVSFGLIFCVIILNNIITQSHGTSTSQSTNSAATTYDQSTNNRLIYFETSSNNDKYTNLPSGRINPFSE